MHITHVTRPFLKHYIIDNLMQSRLSVTCKWLDILLGGTTGHVGMGVTLAAVA